MFIKLARFEDTENNGQMLGCCKQQNVEFVSITPEYFGLLTTNFAMSYGRDDFSSKPETNLTAFINTYNCAASVGVVYTGILLTSEFFRNVAVFCREFEIDVAGIKYMSQYGSEDIIAEPENIKKILNDETAEIRAIYLEIKDVSVIINRIGYVDIADRGTFFSDNKNLIVTMIKLGINDDNDDQ
jgi:hypothetical protein